LIRKPMIKWGAATWLAPCAVLTDSREYIERPDATVTVSQSGAGLTFLESFLTQRDVTFDFLPESYVYAGTSLETLWLNGHSHFAYYPDAAEPSVYAYYFLRTESLASYKPKRDPRTGLYAVTLKMGRYLQ
jgi:hypothetical protein